MSFSGKLIINCGTSHVSMGVFSSNGPGDLVMDDFAVAELAYDFSEETAWMPNLIATAKELVSRHRLSGDAIVICPGNQLLTRPVKVSAVGGDKQEQTIAYEVSKSLPYPLSEVEWGKHLISDDGIEQELLIVAAKKEVAEKMCQIVKALGLNAKKVAGCTALDFNAYKFAFPDSQDDSLIINIGARATNLTFVTADPVKENDFYIRNVNLGGNAFTQNLADHLGKSFSVAENLKLKYYSDPSAKKDDAVGKFIQENAQSFMKKLNMELTRSIAGFRRQRPGHSLKKVYLTGRGALMPGLQEYLSEKLKVEVSFFNPIESFSVGVRVDANQIQHSYLQISELIGEAASEVLPFAVKVNLLPTHITETQEFNKKKPFLVAASVLLALSGVFPWLKLNANLSKLDTQLSVIDARISPLQGLNADIASNVEKVNEVHEKIKKVDQLVNSKYNWINFFVDLQKRIHEVQDIWLEDLSVIRDSGSRRGRGRGRGRSKESEVSEEKKVLELQLSGVILDRHNPLETVSDDITRKAHKLIENVKQSPFIETIKDQELDTDQEGILKFKFVMVVDPKRPL